MDEHLKIFVLIIPTIFANKDFELTVINDAIGTGKIEELLDSDFGFTCITNESCDHRELEASFTLYLLASIGCRTKE